MRSVNSMRSSPLTRWALALSILLLTSCGAAPTKPPSRTKPVAALVAPALPDPPPANISQLTDKQQATVGFQLYRGMTDYAGQLKRKYDELVNWINGEPK